MYMLAHASSVRECSPGYVALANLRSRLVLFHFSAMIWYNLLLLTYSSYLKFSFLAVQSAGLEQYLKCKLQNRCGSAADAASTSLALWLLESILSRVCGASTTGHNTVVDCPEAPAFVKGCMASDALCGVRTWRPGDCEVQEFVRRYTHLLPYNAVEQILLASGCREVLKEIARLYEAWQTVFNMTVASVLLSFMQCICAARHSNKPRVHRFSFHAFQGVDWQECLHSSCHAQICWLLGMNVVTSRGNSELTVTE